VRIEPDRAYAYRTRGDLWRFRNNFEKAIADYSRLLQIRPNDCEVFYYRGLCRCHQEEYEKAIADFDEILCRQPESIRAYQGRGFVWSRRKVYDRAVEDYTEGIRLRRIEVSNWCSMLWNLVSQGDLRRTISTFAQFQTVYLSTADGYLERASCYALQGDYDRAFADSHEALWIDPDSIRGHLLRGNLHSEIGQYGKALADFDAALRLDPKDARVCNAEAWFHATCAEAKYRDARQAVDLGVKACEQSKWNSFSYLDTLAAAKAEAGQFDDAILWQKKALALAIPASKKEMADRLALYESHKPYRAPLKKHI
jgi:tetratricopeptide (TPR) repeat protein